MIIRRVARGRGLWEAFGSEHVEVLGVDFGQAGEDGVEVVVDGEVAAREAVGVAAGEPEEQLDGMIGVRAAALRRAR